MSDVLKILKDARELLSDEKRWTKGMWARTAAMMPTDSKSEDAVCWCAMGALCRVIDYDRDASEFRMATAYLTEALPPSWWGVSVFNDAKATTHADLLAMFDRAIAKAEFHEKGDE